jgi:LPS sulfotransferase NodH
VSALGDLYYRAKGSIPASHLMVLRDRIRGSRWLSREPERAFVIFCQGRSGSTLLTALLNNSPLINCDGEVFGPGVRFRLRDPVRYLDARSRAFHRGLIYGCKIKIYDLTGSQGLALEDAKALIHGLVEKSWRIVYLHRTNWLRQAVSGVVAESRQLYHHRGEISIGGAPVHVDVSNLIWRIELLEEFTRQESEILKGVDHIRLCYETHLRDGASHQRTLNEVLDYLGVPHVPAGSVYLRTSADDLRDDIENFQEVMECLRGTRFERFLADGSEEMMRPVVPHRAIDRDAL